MNLHYIPVHYHPYYKSLGFQEGDFPNAENYYKRAISIPIFPAMDLKQQDLVISAIASIVK